MNVCACINNYYLPHTRNCNTALLSHPTLPLVHFPHPPLDSFVCVRVGACVSVYPRLLASQHRKERKKREMNKKREAEERTIRAEAVRVTQEAAKEPIGRYRERKKNIRKYLHSAIVCHVACIMPCSFCWTSVEKKRTRMNTLLNTRGEKK